MFYWKTRQWIGLIVRIYMGFVFLYACFHKLLEPDLFAVDVATYDILPLCLVNLMAIILPWIELAVGLMIIIGYQVKSNSLLMTGMMVMFMIALSIALFRGLDMSCGCFASQDAEHTISYKTLIRDIIWLVLSIYVLVFDNKPIGLDSLIK